MDLMGTVHSLPVCSRTVQKTTSSEEGPYLPRNAEILSTTQTACSITISNGDMDPSRLDPSKAKRALGWMVNGIASVGHLKHSVEYTTDPSHFKDRLVANGIQSVPVVGSVVGNFLAAGVIGALAAHVKHLSNAVPANVRSPEMFDGGCTYEQLATLVNMSNGVFTLGGKVDFDSAIAGKEVNIQAVDSRDVYRVVFDGMDAKEHQQTKQALPAQIIQSQDNKVVCSYEGWTVLEIKHPLPRSEPLQQAVEVRAKKAEHFFTIWKNEFILAGRKHFGVTPSTRVDEFIDLFNELISSSQEESSQAQEQKGTPRLQQLLLFLGDTRIEKLFEATGQLLSLEQLRSSVDAKTITTGLLEMFNAAKDQSAFDSSNALFKKHVDNLRSIDLSHFNYTRAENAMKFATPKDGMLGVVVVEWAPILKEVSARSETDYTTVRVPAAPLSPSLTNSTQLYTTDDVSIFYLPGQNIPIIEEKIDCSGVKVNSIRCEFEAKFEPNFKDETEITVGIACGSKLSEQGKLVNMKTISVNRNWDNFLVESITPLAEEQFSIVEKLASADSLQLTAYSSEGGKFSLRNIRLSIEYGNSRIRQTKSESKKIFNLVESGVIERYEVSDQILPLFDKIALDKADHLDSIKISFFAKDQGTGARKSSILLRLWDEDGSYSDICLTHGKLKHNWTEYKQESSMVPPISCRALQLMGIVGSGGEQTLFLKNINLSVTVTPSEQLPLVNSEKVQVERNYGDDSSYDPWEEEEREELKQQPAVAESIACPVISTVKFASFETEPIVKILTPLHPKRIPVKSKFNSIKISYRAKGNGSVVMMVWKEDSEIIQKFNISKGTITQDGERQYVFEAKATACNITVNDELQFYYKTEGGIKIQDFECTFRTECHIQKIEIPYFISHVMSDDPIPITPKTVQCGTTQIQRVKVDFDAVDQGWGYQKGQVYLRIVYPNGKRHDISLTRGVIQHHQLHYSYDSEEIAVLASPMSTISFVGNVGGGGGHSLTVKNFVAEIFVSKQPGMSCIRFDKKGQWRNEEIFVLGELDQLEVKASPLQFRIEEVRLQVVDGISNNLRRETILIEQRESGDRVTHNLPKDELRRIAIGDILRLVKEGKQSSFSNFQLKALFKPLLMPEHRVISCEFSDGRWTGKDGDDSLNIVGKDHALTFAKKMMAASASCIWKDSSNTEPTGKLHLVLRRQGKEIDRFDLFGTAKNELTQVFSTFDSNSRLVRSIEVGDELSLERTLSLNGEFEVRGLELLFICAGP